MAVVVSFDLLEGEDEHVSVHAPGRPALPPGTKMEWSFDAGLQGKLSVTPDDTGYVVHAPVACAGTLTLTASLGSQPPVVKTYPVVVTARLLDIVLETP